MLLNHCIDKCPRNLAVGVVGHREGEHRARNVERLDVSILLTKKAVGGASRITVIPHDQIVYVDRRDGGAGRSGRVEPCFGALVPAYAGPLDGRLDRACR